MPLPELGAGLPGTEKGRTSQAKSKRRALALGSAELCLSSISPPRLKEALRPLLGIVESTSKTACLGILFSDSTAAPLSRDKPSVTLGPTVHRQLAR